MMYMTLKIKPKCVITLLFIAVFTTNHDRHEVVMVQMDCALIALHSQMRHVQVGSDS